MIILALDSSAGLCAAAFYDATNGTALGRVVEDIGRGHAERMMAVIEAARLEAGIALKQIDRIAVTVGPGSFTGIRVGVATARGLALALGRPSVGVTTLETLAASAATADGPVMAILDARRDEVFAQVFAADGTPLTDPAALSVAEAADLATRHDARLIGTGASLVASLTGQPERVISEAGTVEILDVARIGAGKTASAPPAPLYLRSPDAKPQEAYLLARQERLAR